MAAMYVRLALGEPVKTRDACDFAENFYLVRSVDTLPAVIHADKFFENIEDARE